MFLDGDTIALQPCVLKYICHILTVHTANIELKCCMVVFKYYDELN